MTLPALQALKRLIAVGRHHEATAFFEAGQAIRKRNDVLGPGSSRDIAVRTGGSAASERVFS